jgi:hypothetical protein
LERDLPLKVGPSFSLADELDARKIDGLVERLRSDRPLAMGEVLHALRLFGAEMTCKPPTGSGQPLPLLDAVLDNQTGRALFGSDNAPLIETREGVRSRVVQRREARWQRERQNHEDQLLAVLAEVGVPLSRSVRTESGEHTVRNILDDLLANFDLKKGEFEWAALSVTLYLPPRNSWVDRYGKTYTLDDVALELMGRLGRPDLSCAGTHLLYSMTVLLRVDEQEPVLSPEVRGQLREKLRETALSVRRVQTAEGAWGPNWSSLAEGKLDRGLAGAFPTDQGVLATGHHVEWLMLLPPDLLPPRDCFLAALRWLQVRLEVDDLEKLRVHYCPYSHAGRVLQVLSRPREGYGSR